MRLGAVLPLIVLGQMALAAAPDSSTRPEPRPGAAVVVVPSGALKATRRAVVSLPVEGLAASLRPKLRSRQAEKAAQARRELLARGAVCGDVAIQGERLGRVAGRIAACGVDEAVKVRSVSGIRLSRAAVMDCPTAKALDTWVRQSAVPSLAGLGGGLKELRVAADYICRTRNNQQGAKVSEHGKGRAIDIAGFGLADGSEVTVLQGWNARRSAEALRVMHRGACGPFGTVLGPDADRFHRDHFHFDTARHRSGSYCR